MTRFLAILTIASFVLLPLQFSVRALCDCIPLDSLAGSPATLLADGSSAPCCCPSAADRSRSGTPAEQPDEPDRPCNDGNCPMPCCGLVKTFAAPNSLPAGTPTESLVIVATPADTGAALSPHLGTLTRPPIHAAAL